MGDKGTSDFLDKLVAARTRVGWLGLGDNNLTRIPSQVVKFTEMDTVVIVDNQIESIQYGAFNFTGKLSSLSLRNNSIRSIQAGAFQGNNQIQQRFVAGLIKN